MDQLAHLVYRLTKSFPREEMFGITPQIRRASLSVVLNYTEGYARIKGKVYKNFLEISYGSLQETKYLLHFSYIEKYVPEPEYRTSMQIAEEVGAMLWGTIEKIKTD